MSEQFIAKIESIITQDVGKRGIKPLIVAGDLGRATVSLLEANTIFILTGFFVDEVEVCETDGPPGAVVLANALSRMDRRVIVVTDEPNRSVVEPLVMQFAPLVELISVAVDEGEAYYAGLIEEYNPTHLIAVERLGRASDGSYRNMRATDIASQTAALDWLFVLGQKQGLVTIGIGDGGNEIGMGKVERAIHVAVDHGGTIACVVGCDYLITCGVTNWGAYGLTACLSEAIGQDLLHNVGAEATMLEVMLKHGAVDGTTKKCEPMIDGQTLQVHQRIVTDIRQALDAVL